MQTNTQRLAELLATNDIDIERSKVMDATILSVNPDRTVNVMVAGVPILSLPSNRTKVGLVKVIRTHDGHTFVV